MKTKKGSTLVDVLIVLFIIGVVMAIAYNEEAKKHYGEFAYLNVII